LEIAGVEIIDLSADEYDHHLIIEAIGKSKGGSVTAFTGAELSWTILFKGQNLEPHKKEFSDKRAVLGHIVGFLDLRFSSIRELIDAFLDMFWYGGFLDQLGEIIVSDFDLDPVEFYIEALNNENEKISYRAAEILSEIGDSRALEPLILALQKDSIFVRRGAAVGLGKLGDSRAVEPLILTLKNIGKYQRPAVIEALGKLGDPRAVEHIIPWLKKPTTRDEALEALIQLTGQDFGEDQKKWQKWWKENKKKFLKKK